MGDIFHMRTKRHFQMKAHTIAYVKRQAKKLKTLSNITHTQALDLLCKELGYSNWKHFLKVITPIPKKEIGVITNLFYISFTDWLKKHKNRNSPLGDLATDMLRDNEFPSSNTLEDYQRHLNFKRAATGATEALIRAWRTYNVYLKKKNAPVSEKKSLNKPVTKKYDPRKIVFVKKVTPLHYAKRTTEKFIPADKDWISWDGRKAIPVTILEVDERHYSFRIERPLKNAGDEFNLFLDEVRSTPELACKNHVTM